MKTLICAISILILSAPAFAEKTKVRIGWQIPWAVQGQLVQILKHTDILAKNDLEAEFIGRTFGPELNEIALAGAVDMILTADQPAATLFSKDKGWKAISRLMYNRTATYVPPSSDVKTMADLKGKKIGIPLGAAAERITLSALSKAGVEAKDAKITNLDIKEQAPLIMKAGKDSKTWGDFDALSGFDPIPANLEAKGAIRVLHVGKVVSMVLMNESFMAKNTGVAKKFTKALEQAYEYYRAHTAEANQWFKEEAKMTETPEKALELAASIEPNLKAGQKISLTLNSEDLAILQEAADFLAPKINKKVAMRDYIAAEALRTKK